MYKECSVCRISTDLERSVDHPKALMVESKTQLKFYLQNLMFFEEPDGGLICSECADIISETINEMESNDE